MAGERKGISYEAIVQVALNSLAARGKLSGSVFWNERPEVMSIEPDFTVGKDKNSPDVVFLVTHSGSTKESDKKFWRNLGELVEAKVRLPRAPRVYSIAFDSAIKNDLKLLQDAVFDGQLIVAEAASYGPELLAWVEANHKTLPKRGVDKARRLAELLETDRVLAAHVTSLAKDIVRLIRRVRPELDSLWQRERSRKRVRVPTSRETFVRRGLSKLLVFDDLELALKFYRTRRARKGTIPDYAFTLGLATRSISGAAPADSDVLSVVDLLTDKQIGRIIEQSPIERLSESIGALRSLGHFQRVGEYVLKHRKKLVDAKSLSRILAKLHRDPKSVSIDDSSDASWTPDTVWLFEYLLEILRLASGSANGYGYAKLEQDVARMRGTPPAGDRAYRIVLPDWVHRRGQEQLDGKLLDAFSQSIAARLVSISESELREVVSRAPETLARHLVEVKIGTYRLFEPLFCLLKAESPKARRVRIQSCFAGYAGLGGQASKTSLAQVGSTLVNWQSAHGSHTNDKRKELCGRAPALRYEWSASRREFVPRAGVSRLLLIVDGTWTQSDLDSLAAAGWDGIFYPDEIDKLVEEIV